MKSSSVEVRIGGASLINCAAKKHREKTMDALDASGLLENLIYVLVDMLKHQSNVNSLELEVWAPRNFMERKIINHDADENDIPDPANVLGEKVALWMLSIISSSQAKNELTVMEAGGVEVLSDKLAGYAASPQVWPSLLLRN